MKPLYIILLAVLFAACKKEKTEPSKPVVYSEPDFALIPTKDATWYVHIITDENNCFEYRDVTDAVIAEMTHELANHYYVIKSTGLDRIEGGKNYHVYNVRETIVPPDVEAPDNKPYTNTYSYLLREDTVSRKVYSGYDKNPQYNESYLVLDFSDSANQGMVTPFPTWPVMDITAPNGLVFNREKFKSWNMQNVQDRKLEYFYKAIGIGSATGILNYKTGGISVYQVVSLDFVYKGDSLHFDYPLQ